MSDAVLVSVAKAITKELDAAFIAGTFGAQYREQRAKRSYADWDEALEDLDTLHVDVVPVGPGNPKLVMLTRSAWEYVVSVQIGVRKRFGHTDQDSTTGRILAEEIDALILLLEKIGKYFMPSQTTQTGRRLADMPEAVWMPEVGERERGTEFQTSFDREMLRNNRQYIGIVRLTYKVPRNPNEA